MEFKDKLLKLRKEQGLSQQELADQLHVSRQSVSKWELGESQPDINNIKILSDLFQVSADYLLKDDIVTNQKDEAICQKVFVIALLIVLFGVICSQMLWKEYQDAISLLIGMFIQIVGIGIFEYFAIAWHNEKIQKKFWSINIWLVTLIPIQYFVNYTQTFEYLYMKLFSFVDGNISSLLYMYLPFLIALGFSAVLFIFIRKLF